MDGDLVALVRNPDTELVEAVRYQVRLPGTPTANVMILDALRGA